MVVALRVLMGVAVLYFTFQPTEVGWRGVRSNSCDELTAVSSLRVETDIVVL
jgi:hypothetical protein